MLGPANQSQVCFGGPAPSEPPSWDNIPLRRVPAQARSRDKVARALAAADQIVRTEGPEAVSLPHVAQRAGVSVGALYQYLPDREAIVGALVWRYHERLESLLDQAIAAARLEPPPEDPVGHMIDSVVRVYGDEESARALRGTQGTPALRELSRAHKRRMAAKLAALLAALGMAVPGQDADLAAQVAFIAADAVLHEAFAAPPARRPAVIAELRRLVSSYLSAVQDPPAP
ncbi:MAG: TetR/AcrR family transcriptional regulator [Bifidobacteriaceae bacterium]|jgi:AcrR family transcriptional regulator|nr:TetR/AcrR family transcriptional regulator [Bifidobacteriaceae bacterium]